MKNVVLYARSSTSDQNLDDQLKSMRSLLGPETTVVATYSDRAPATAPQRTVLKQALNDPEHHEVGALMVHSIDRLARTTGEIAEIKSLLQGRGIELLIASDLPNQD